MVPLILAAFGVGTLPNLLAISVAVGHTQRWMQVPWVCYIVSVLIAAVGIYGMLHVFQPATLRPDSLLCRIAPGLNLLPPVVVRQTNKIGLLYRTLQHLGAVGKSPG